MTRKNDNFQNTVQDQAVDAADLQLDLITVGSNTTSPIKPDLMED